MKAFLPKVIIDTDAGHDDALAMMLLINSQKLDIQSVTTVAGNSTIDNVTRNAQAVLDLLNSKIPLYSGSHQPLVRKLVKAVVHGESGLDGLDMSLTQYQLTGDAMSKMAEIAQAHPHQVTILTLGPLTNLARLFQEHPKLVGKVKEVVIMGGAINVAGNKNRVAEFNFFVDPEAAEIVFEAEVKKILIPLDPCNEVVLDLSTFEFLKGTKLYQPLKSMMKHFIAGIEKDEGVKGALVYDALAAYYLLNPEAFKLQPMDILIETHGEHTAGMTVAEKRHSKPQRNNVFVALEIDQKQFLRDLGLVLSRH